MEIYIALLRGINVSGQKQIKMTDLKICLEEAGFQKVKTYIQSGNVVFEHESTNPQLVAGLVEQTILERFGFDIHVRITTASELKVILETNPYLNGREEDIKLLYVSFLSEEPAPISIENLQKVNCPEEFRIAGKHLYLFATNGYGNAKLNNNLIENKLKLKATTRNWNTITKLAEMAQA
ncbi:DUF1697 domain-containing protein [Pontibacter liquoris]|uniref:DUF1697 domain-containing protein n=1 Tax=Pontibacter liquoris TaxID=2905677 RepID=UPI001FA7D6D9|nr:DUF1697 domain-containing protein [Pontibacter liquoris]